MDLNSDDIFQPSSIMGTAVNQANNTISLNTGFVVSNNPIGPTVQLWQQVGLASIPALPEPGVGSAESLNLIRGTGDISIATRDLRSQSVYGNLSPGEVCLYATGPVASNPAQGKILIKGDGSINLMTTADTLQAGGNIPTANTAGGPAVMFRVATDSLTFVSPWGSLVFDQTGFHIQTVGGAAFDLTNLSGLPGLPPGVTPSNSCQITANMTTINSANTFIGPDNLSGGLVYMPAVLGIVPPVAPLIPILGEGVGAVTVQAASSTKVFIGV